MAAKPRALIVDDEQANLDLLTHILESSDMETISARDGVEAMKKLKEFSTVDVILLDWMMPNMDGIQMLKALKADPSYCEIPVIMQTAVGSPKKVQEAMEAGAHTYLVKPYDDTAIIKAIRDAQSHSKRKAQW